MRSYTLTVPISFSSNRISTTPSLAPIFPNRANRADFRGWFADSEFSGEAIEKILPGETGDRIFFAKFVPITYEITHISLIWKIVDDPLIYEYTYSDTQDVVLKLLPAVEELFLCVVYGRR